MKQSTQTVLLVDDDANIRQYLREKIERLGYEVATAFDGESFRRSFKRSKPDVILLDLMIPGSDSIEMLKFLAASHCVVPVVLMSGLDERTISAAKKLGHSHGLRMFGGLEKPFDHAKLEAVLAKTGREKHDLAEENLMEAIDRGELRIHYQPQVNAGDGSLIGAEALLRWQHPEYGIL
ncbi:MAG: DNA-binding response OmpR family regulator, partial [Candidatus Paceibacteria bacterium]